MRSFSGYIFLVVIALVLSSGCISYSTLHTAAPVEAGETKTTLGASYYGGEFDGDSVEIPYTEVAVRYGVSDESDLGFKLFPVGFAFDYNHAVLQDDALTLSVNPYLSVTRLSSSEGSLTYGIALANILADVVQADAITVTLGLKPGVLYGIGGGEGIDTATGGVIGGMAGVGVKLSEGLTVMPNVDVITPFEEFGDLWFYNFGLAVTF